MFLKERQIWLGRFLAFHYVSCFNASLLRNHFVNLFCFTLYKRIYRPAYISYFNQDLR